MPKWPSSSKSERMLHWSVELLLLSVTRVFFQEKAARELLKAKAAGSVRPLLCYSLLFLFLAAAEQAKQGSK